MKVVVFGASGMVGHGVLRECLLDPGVDRVVTVGRSPLSRPADSKLEEVIVKDFTAIADVPGIREPLSGVDACFFCLGVSSVGMSEADYTRVTYDFTLAAGRLLAELNPGMTFIYVSGAGTDGSEQGRTMWARVKGKTENDLIALPLQAYAFRPGVIQPMHGATSRVRAYRWLMVGFKPLWPLLKAVWPNSVTTTERIGKAMLAVARKGYPSKVLEPRDINTAAQG